MVALPELMMEQDPGQGPLAQPDTPHDKEAASAFNGVFTGIKATVDSAEDDDPLPALDTPAPMADTETPKPSQAAPGDVPRAQANEPFAGQGTAALSPETNATGAIPADATDNLHPVAVSAAVERPADGGTVRIVTTAQNVPAAALEGGQHTGVIDKTGQETASSLPGITGRLAGRADMVTVSAAGATATGPAETAGPARAVAASAATQTIAAGDGAHRADGQLTMSAPAPRPGQTVQLDALSALPKGLGTITIAISGNTPQADRLSATVPGEARAVLAAPKAEGLSAPAPSATIPSPAATISAAPKAPHAINASLSAATEATIKVALPGEAAGNPASSVDAVEPRTAAAGNVSPRAVMANAAPHARTIGPGAGPAPSDAASTGAMPAQNGLEPAVMAKAVTGNTAAGIDTAAVMTSSPIGAAQAAAPGTVLTSSVAPTAASLATDPAIQQQALNQIASVLEASQAGPRRMELRLDPPELGRVSIDFRFDGDNRITAILTADQPETASMMRRSLDILMRDLSAAGFSDVSLSMGNSGGQEKSAGFDQRQPGQATRAGLAMTDQEDAAPTESRTPVSLHDTDFVDIRL